MRIRIRLVTLIIIASGRYLSCSFTVSAEKNAIDGATATVSPPTKKG